MKTIDLSGGLVLVTGGAGAIGRAIAIDAAAAGAAVAVCDSNQEAAETVAAAIRCQGGVAVAFPIDVRNRDDVVATTEQAVEQLGCLRGLVTAAGILHTGPLAEQNSSDWQELMAVNVNGTLHAVQAAIPHLTASRGAIVTLGSVSAFIGSSDGGAYTTSKGAVLSFTYAAAGELASRGIRVNNVAPGWVDGGFTHQALRACPEPEALRAKAKRLHPLGRMAMPADVAHAVTWLLSDQAGFITGSMLLVDGGFMVQHNA
ncbi:SDR family NAD(P)-dependent oxidoreductase [Synechococcus sp. RS9916]|uniref:SDR family NAD(P)-dependent oxidoreductase n=1 Tax=Synechococcus sp. RS9916 TaxID=221359 RepID=UPI0000E5482F|nr:SDR family NAD(P)-dependent oxidoreductase [Synechococcus sp. RS9916]EAU72754.1 Short-chain dehydrogenase/reductase SDR [Synechococcus sp. RS9916]